MARRPLADIYAMQLLLLNIQEAYGVGLLFPERTLAERAARLDIRLNTCQYASLKLLNLMLNGLFIVVQLWSP